MGKPIRVLQVGEWDFGKNGIATIVYNLAQNIDISKYIFDFLVIEKVEDLYYKNNIEKRMGKVYELGLKKNKLKKLYEVIKILKFIKKNNYQIIHIHESTSYSLFFYGFLFKIFGDGNIIFHSHNSNLPSGHKIKKILHKIFKNVLNLVSKNSLACSKEAANWMYPKKYLNNVMIVKNAIDFSKFLFCPQKRKKIQKELKLEKSIVLGNIGRFSEQKNQLFLVELLQYLVKKEEKIKLLLIGNGNLKEEIIRKVTELNLKNNVILIENIKNIEDYYQVMDFFLLPSLYEGLPIVGIEAQAMGLPCYFSDTITSEIKILDNVKFLNLNISYWEKVLINDLKSKINREINNKKLQEEFSIQKMCKKIECYYDALEIN